MKDSICPIRFVTDLGPRLARTVALAMVLLAGLVASAGTLYWDGGTTDIGANGDGAGGGGSGIWNTTTINWDRGSGLSHVAWTNSNSDSATFAGTAGTVTLGSNIEIRISLNEALNFTVGNYTIAGNGYTIKTFTNTGISANNNTFDSALTLDTSTYTLTLGGGSATAHARFTGAGKLWKRGGGVWKITNTANDYSGGTDLHAGTVLFGAGTLGSGIVTFTQTGGILQWDTGNSQDISSRLRINAGVTASVDVGANNVSFANAFGTTSSGAVSSGGLTKLGSGALTLSGSSSFTGVTTVKAGTLIAGVQAPSGSAGAFGNATSAVLLGDTTGSANAALYTGGSVSIGRPVTVQSGNAGTISLGGNTDNTSAFGGVITANKDLTVAQVATTGTHTLQITGGIVAGSPGTKILTFNNVGSVNASAAIADGSGTIALVKSGAGTLKLYGPNTYTGPTTIKEGTLQVGDGGATGSLATSGITNNATLVYNRSDNVSVGYVISGSGQLIKQGAGTLNLTVTPAYTGDTIVAAGTLTLNNPAPSNDSSTLSIAASGATLNLNFMGNEVVQQLFVGGTRMSNGVYKAFGNPAPGTELAQLNGAGTLTVSGDVTPPALVSFGHDQLGKPIPVNTVVTYTVTFSEDVDAGTVSAADFANAGTAPLSIGPIVETAPGVFTVPVTPTGAGTLQLKMPVGASVADVFGNVLVLGSDLVDDSVLSVFRPDGPSPALRGISPVANSSGTNLSIAMPAGTKPGDLLIANVAEYASGTASVTASGWTQIDARRLGNQSSYFGAVFYKVASANETGPFTFTLGGGSPVAAGVILAISDVETVGGAFDASTGILFSGTSATTAVGPAAQVTTVSPNAVVLMLGMAVGTDSVSWSGWSNTSPGTLAELYDVTGSGTGNFATSLGAAWGIKAAPGATGTGSATLSAAARNGSILLALKPSYSSSLLSALSALKAHVTGEVPLSDAQIAAHKATIEAQQARFGSSASAIHAALDLVQTYDELLGPLWVARTLPDRAVITDDLHYTIFTVMQNIIDWTYTSANLVNQQGLLNGFAFGSSANFPGPCPSPADPNQVHTAVISGNYSNSWGRPTFHEDASHPAPKPTGTYLAPGSIATVTVPPALVGRGYRVRVGAHSWDYSSKPFIKRLDRCSLVYTIVSTNTQVANPLGGGIYVEVPAYVTDVGIVTVEIRNAVRSPYFSAKSFHRTTLAEWQNKERLHPAPWADFQSEKVMMQVPTSWIYALNDPVKLMADWDLASDICNDLMGFPHDRGRETLYNQVDLLIRAGAYAPGYPAVNNTYTPGGNYGGYANSYLVRGPQYAPDFEFHEHGHGYLFPKFPGEVESVVNLLHVPVWHRGFGYSLDEAFRKSRSGYTAYATLDTTAIAWMMCDNFLNGVAMTQVEKQYQLKGHAKFVDIARMFGWEKLHDHYYSFNQDYENGLTIATDVDSLLLRLSRDVGVDIRPLFHFWGVPPVNSISLSNAVKAANLPASAAIYDTLVRYKALVPANNASFRYFATNWWGYVPSTNGYTEEYNHAVRWDTYDEALAAATAGQAQQIIDLYFPGGKPSDYAEWAWQWPGANLVNPNADADGDGLSNDYERVWGLNPTNAAARTPFLINAGLSSGKFSYTRRTPALTGLKYSIWTSTDLANWTQDTGAVQVPAVSVNQVETVAVTLSPARLTGPRLFIRLAAAP